MNPDELATLYGQYAPLICVRARRIVGDQAEDVTQDVFEKLIEKDQKIHNLEAWMYRTSTNLCLDRLRYIRRRDSNWKSGLNRHIQGLSLQDPEKLLTNQDLCRQLLAMSKRKVQQVVMLVYFDELSQVETAALLGISRKTVADRLECFRKTSLKVVDKWQKQSI